MSKLRDDLKIYESELKRAKFVYENYDREVARLKRELEGEETKQEAKSFLEVPQ